MASLFRVLGEMSLSVFSAGDFQQQAGVMKAAPAMNSFIDHGAFVIKDHPGRLPGPAALINVSALKRHQLGEERYLVFVFTRSYRLL